MNEPGNTSDGGNGARVAYCTISFLNDTDKLCPAISTGIMNNAFDVDGGAIPSPNCLTSTTTSNPIDGKAPTFLKLA